MDVTLVEQLALQNMQEPEMVETQNTEEIKDLSGGKMAEYGNSNFIIRLKKYTPIMFMITSFVAIGVIVGYLVLTTDKSSKGSSKSYFIFSIVICVLLMAGSIFTSVLHFVNFDKLYK